MVNARAYYDMVTMTVEKSFIVHATLCILTKLCVGSYINQIQISFIKNS
jgi:hypothetical protein